MSSWREILHFLSGHNDEIEKTTRPLRECFGIKYFTYHRIDNNGNYTVLLDRPDWAEHYIEKKFYLQDPYQRHPRFFKSGIHLIDSLKGQDVEHIIQAGKDLFSMDLGVTIIETGDDGVEFFGFAASRATSTLERIYLEQPSLLREYGVYFKKQMHRVLDRVEPGYMPDLKGDHFFSGEVLDSGLSITRLHHFLSQIGYAAEVKKAKLLSPREKSCLLLLLENKTAKEIASDLLLSFRTVEFYFENIKNKLGCHSKQQLFGLAKKFQQLGLLP
jgi:LuxR family transcriptional regulator